MRNFLAAVVVAASPSLAVAQLAPDAATVQYLNSKAFGEATIYMGMLLDKSVLLMERCGGSYGYEPVSIAIEQPLQFASGKEHPVSGRWTYRFNFKRCGAEKVYTIKWDANAGNLPKPSALPAGMSRADLALALTLKEAVGSAGLERYSVPADCRTIRVPDTKVTMEPATLTIDGAKREGVWEEEWTAHMCGVDFKVPLCLVPVEGGTNWTSKSCPR